mgnify:CR=1 FL=1
MTSFRHLDVPDQWNNYWSKYPNGYTILEALLNWVDQVNAMSDNLNEVNLRLDDFINQFDAELQETVGVILRGWEADGTLARVINEEVFGEMDRRLNDLAINVDSFLTPAAAVDYAYQNNRILSWGNKEYAIIDSIPNMHSVEHIGLGVIVRSGVKFCVEPRKTQTNTLYVDYATGNDLNDGLTTLTAFRTLQKAFDVLDSYARPMLKANWVVTLSAGTYPRARLKDGLPSENRILIQGANVGSHPTVPTTLISEGSNVGAMGIRFDGKVKVKLKNLKVSGFKGTTSSSGINAANGVDLETENVHTEGCHWGISSQNSNCVVPDGIHENHSGGGIRSLQLNRHAIGKQNNGSRNDTCIFKNNTAGVFVQENCTGHVDWCTLDGNTDGVIVNINSRVNADSCEFKNNFRGIRQLAGSNVYVTDGCIFTNNNADIVKMSGSSIVTSRYFEGTPDVGYSTNDSNVHTVYVNKDIKNTTSEPFYTTTLKAPFWKADVNSITPMKKLAFTIYGNITNNTGAEGSGTKAINMRLGSGLTGATLGITEQGSFKYTGEIYFPDNSTQYMFLEGNTHLNANRQSRKIATNAMSQDVKLTLEAQTEQPLDTVHIDLIEFRMAG